MFRWNGVNSESESKLLANHLENCKFCQTFFPRVFFPSTWLFSVLQKAYIISVCTQQRNYLNENKLKLADEPSGKTDFIIKPCHKPLL